MKEPSCMCANTAVPVLLVSQAERYFTCMLTVCTLQYKVSKKYIGMPD